MSPRGAFIERLIETGVGARDKVVPIVRVNPQGVVVAVLLASGAEVVEGRAAVAGDMEEDIHLIHEIGILGRGFDLLVVVRTGSARQVGVAPCPMLAFIHHLNSQPIAELLPLANYWENP